MNIDINGIIEALVVNGGLGVFAAWVGLEVRESRKEIKAELTALREAMVQALLRVK